MLRCLHLWILIGIEQVWRIAADVYPMIVAEYISLGHEVDLAQELSTTIGLRDSKRTHMFCFLKLVWFPLIDTILGV